MKLDTILSEIEGFKGLSAASTKAYKRRVQKLFSLHEDLSEHKKTIEAVEDGVTNTNTKKDLFATILAVAKRSSKFKEWVGEDGLSAYLAEVKKGNEKVVKKSESATSDEEMSIPSIQSLMEALPKIQEKLGETSSMFLAAYLQVNIVGLRDDLGAIRVVSKFNPKFPKQYVKSNGRLYISEFKTSKTYGPYDIKLEKGVRAVIDKVLKSFPDRKFLVTESLTAGDLVRKAFSKAGMKVSVNTIRHAQVSELIDKNPTSIPHIQEGAERFKHSEAVHRTYYRKTESKT